MKTQIMVKISTRDQYCFRYDFCAQNLVSLPCQSQTAGKWVDLNTLEVIDRLSWVLAKVPEGAVTKNLCYFAFSKNILQII